MKRRKKSQPRATALKPTRAKRTNAQQERLRQARIDTIRDVAAVLGHETRNLLGALGTCVQVLRKNPQITEDDAELLDIIQSGSRRLNEIVSEFSAFGRSKAFEFEEVELRELVEQTLALLQRDDRCSPSIVMRPQLDPSVRYVRADREQMQQLLLNLFLNAVQAMGDKGQLDVETHRAGREIKILVRDTGPGIPREVLRRIFEPLYSTKSRGAGLGLSIARSIVEGHGGRIAVESENGKGTSFIVRLPIERKG